MSEAEHAEPSPPRRSLRRRILLAALVVLALLLIFHQPLLRFTLRQVVRMAAERENIRLELEVEGDLLSSLILRNVRAIPVGPSPIERLEIGSAEFHYRFIDLFRGGYSEFLTSYQLKDTVIEFTPVKGTVRQKHELATLLRDIVQQPALFSDQVTISNFNLTVKTPDGLIRLLGIHALLDPIIPGYVRADEISLPKIITWKNVRALASYRGRKLSLRDFHLGNEIFMKSVELDSSRRKEGINYLSVEGSVLDGDLGLFLWRRSENDETEDIQMTLSLRRFPLDRLAKLLRWEPEVSGTVTHAWVQMTGDPDEPSSWNGNALLDVDDLRIEGMSMERVDGFQMVTNGLAEFKGSIVTGSNRLAFQTRHELPDTIDALFATGVTAAVELDAPELPRFSPVLEGGHVTGKGKLSIEKKRLSLTMDTEATQLEGTVAAVPLRLESSKAAVKVDYPLLPRLETVPWHEGLEADAQASFGTVRVGPAVLDSGAFHATVHNGSVVLEDARLQRGRNDATLHGRLKLPDAGRPLSWKTLEAALAVEAKAPDLSELAPEEDPQGLRGTLEANAELRRSGGKTTGKGNVEAEDVAYREFNLHRLSVSLPVESETLHIRDLSVNLNHHDTVTGSGLIALEAPFAYEGKLKADIRDLGIFHAFVGKPLGGALALEWHGSGQISPLRNRGEGQLTLKDGRFDTVTQLEAEIAGRYSPEGVDFPTFRIRSALGGVEAALQLKGERLTVDPLRLTVGEKAVIFGRLMLPLDLRTPENPETLLPRDVPLEARLRLDPVALRDLALLRAPFSSPAPLPRKKAAPLPEGIVAAELTAHGTLAAPVADLALQLREFRLPESAKAPPAALDAALHFEQNRLTLSGTASVPDVTPLRFSGEIPLPLREVLRTRRLDPATPLKLQAQLPPTSAAAIPRLAPKLRFVEGQLALDATVTGSLERPVFGGEIQIRLPAIRFRDANLPGINNLTVDLRLEGDRLQVRRFTGDVSGGPFSLGGNVGLSTPANPELDLRFRTRNTLLLRNDSMVVRADSDIHIGGPFRQAKVSGKVGIRRSRFFREIEIIPLGLPGNPAPQPASVASTPSITAAPFRDWTFDVAIATTRPLIIRSNLAAGRVFANLRLGGTGLAPTLEGTARMENLVASLPFSRLEVANGYLYFTADRPFDPILDIHGTSQMRNFNIHAYIYGTASEPQTVFTSEPPLPQEEIVTLLATGATAQEVSDNSEVLAGRAGFLLLQDLYQKVFKRRRMPPRGPASRDSFANRFHLDVGTVDPRTGRQQVGGRFTLSRHFEIAAGIDLEGDVRAELRYLIRFR